MAKGRTVSAEERAYQRVLGPTIVQLRAVRGISQATLAEEIDRSEAALTERRRMDEARAISLRRARDFRGRPRALLLAKAIYLWAVSRGVPLGALRKRLA